MRTVPDDKCDFEELERLNAADWQVVQLKRNPDYVFWGIGEDYMGMPDENKGWSGSLIYPTWNKEENSVDELNVIANFYFELTRDSIECIHCDGSGHNPATKVISDTFYDHEGDGSKRWVDKITDDEVDALWEHKRLHQFKEKPTAREVNAREKTGSVHDGINRWILIETRAKRLCIWGDCEHCVGLGYIFTAPNARLVLNLWKLHPRKGAARGIRIDNILETDLPEVLEMLREAAKQNAERFSKLGNLS